MTGTFAHMTILFQQLGLDSSNEAIATFIANHQLEADMSLIDAPFWNESQRQFLHTKIKTDDGTWAIIVDQLNEALHDEAVKRSQQV